MTNLKALLEWWPRTPFFYGWLIIGMAALGTFAASGLSQGVLGGIQGFILEDMGWKKSTIALAVTAGTWSSAVLSPFAGRLTDRYGPRWLMPVGTIIAGISLMSLAGIDSVLQFYVAYILGRALSNALLTGVVPRTAAVNFFRRRRNMALALVGMSRPVGVSISIPIISTIASHYRWNTAYRYLGIFSLALTFPLLVIMRRRPEDIGLLPDGSTVGDVTPGRSEPVTASSGAGPEEERRRAVVGDAEFDWKAGEAFRTRAFWLVAAASALGTLGVSSVDYSIVPYLHEQADISRSRAAAVLSISTFLAITNVGWGYLADRYTPRWCFVVSLACSVAVVFYLFGVSSPAMAYLFAPLWGLFAGSIGVLGSMVVAQYFGRASYGAIMGSVTPLQTGALGLGPSLGALVRDTSGSYKGLYGITVAAYLLAALLMFLARPPARPQRPADESVGS